MTPRRLSQVLIGLTLVGIAWVAAASVATGSYSNLVGLALPVSFLTVGWLVVRSEPSHVEGRLLLLIAFAWTVALGTPLEGGWVLPVGLMGTHLILRFPNGRLPSPRWRPFSIACTAMIVVNATVVTVASKVTTTGDVNRLYVPGVVALSPILVLLPVFMVVSAVSVFVRFRRAGPVERAQVRWLAAAALAVVIIYVVTLVASFGYDAAHNIDSSKSSYFADQYPAWLLALQMTSLLSFLLIPTAIGIAIRRYRLYDIDRLISRTASYVIVTALVLATYALVVTAIASLLPDSSSSLAVAAATLTAAALARPLQQRVQRLVDRRFDRTHYNRQATIDAFGELTRRLVDSDEIGYQLDLTIMRSLQPKSSALVLTSRHRRSSEVRP